MKINRNKIIQTFTKYGYINVDACEPNDSNLLKDIKVFNLEFTSLEKGWNCPEYKLQGLYMDIYDILEMYWGSADEYMDGFVNISKGEK